MKFPVALMAAVAAFATVSAQAVEVTTTTFTFDEVASFDAIGSTYGSVAVFSDEALALSNDGTGTGVNGEFYTNAPSMTAIMFAPGVGESVIVSAVSGQYFVNEVSFYFSSAVDISRAVAVYTGENGTGTRLGSISLDENADLLCSDSEYCNWQRVSITFPGQAKSIVIKGGDGLVGYDNFTVSSVPETETYAMLLAGLLTLGTLARRRA